MVASLQPVGLTRPVRADPPEDGGSSASPFMFSSPWYADQDRRLRLNLLQHEAEVLVEAGLLSPTTLLFKLFPFFSSLALSFLMLFVLFDVLMLLTCWLSLKSLCPVSLTCTYLEPAFKACFDVSAAICTPTVTYFFR